MPTKKTGGKGIKKKAGPLPVYAWVLIGGIVVVGYIYYRRRQSSATNSIAGSLDQQVIPSGVVQPAQSSSGGTNSSGGISSSPATFPSDYATQSDLASAVQSVNDATAAAIAGATFQAQPTPANPNPQTPVVNITVPPAHVQVVTQQSKTAAKRSATAAAPKKITYYTYKKNVPLKAGQSIHFAKGKGYYAA